MVEKRSFAVACVLVLSLSFTVLASRPKVIEATPDNGTMDVDPQLKYIKVVYDQDMTTGEHYSVVGGGPKLPKIIGKPRWRNKRTLVVRVRLKPNHDYWLSFNSETFTYCMSASGEPAVPYPISFSTGSASGDQATETDADIELGSHGDAVTALRGAIDESYSYKDIRGVDWDKLFAEYDEKLKSARTPDQFARTVSKMLAHTKDKHIWLMVGEKHYWLDVGRVTPNANFANIKDFVPKMKKLSKVVFTGEFEDGIGYILIDSWSNDAKEALEQVYAAIWELSDAPGLIIDVRGNGGGAEPLAQKVAGCFIDSRKMYAKHVYRDTIAEGGFGKESLRYVEPNKRRPKYRSKIAVLTGPVVMSSCEAFVLMMKQVPGCKLVGAATQGSSGNPKPHDLGNGVTVYLPSWKAMRPDGSCFEGEGIKPDIEVRAETGDFADKDPVIEAALKYLRNNK